MPFVVLRRRQQSISISIHQNTHRLSSTIGSEGLVFLSTGKLECRPLQSERAQRRFARVRQLIEIETVEIKATRKELLIFVHLFQGDVETFRLFRPEHHQAGVSQAIGRKAQGGSVRAGEGAAKKRLNTTGGETFSAELDDAMVVGKTLLHRTQDLHFQIEGLELRRDLRGQHQALCLPRRIAVSYDQFLECHGAILHIRLLD